MKTLIGIDWSQKHHDVRIHNEVGACLAKLQIPHSLTGFQQLEQKIKQFNSVPNHCLVAIETADNLRAVVDEIFERLTAIFDQAKKQGGSRIESDTQKTTF